MSKLMLSVFLVLFLLPVPRPGSSVRAVQSTQKATTGKFNHAVVRSEDSAKILSLLNELSISNFPKELGDRAEAIAIFPQVTHDKVLFMQSTQGYGVICARRENGWSLPAFYQFAGAGFSSKIYSENQIAVVLLFMNKESVSWFEKGRVGLEAPKKIAPGPVGVLTEQQKKEIESAMVLGYVYDNSHLRGIEFGKSFKMQLDPDNNINIPVYGMKGREVLAAKKSIDQTKLPAGLVAFQEAVAKYHKR